MTDKELMQQALEALEADEHDMVPDQEGHMVFRKEAAITALRERLAQPEQEPVARMNDLLRRAWDALDTFKQAYPENWHDEDQQVLKDLMRADLRLSGVQLKWVGLTATEVHETEGYEEDRKLYRFARAIEAKLKEKNA